MKVCVPTLEEKGFDILHHTKIRCEKDELAWIWALSPKGEL